MGSLWKYSVVKVFAQHSTAISGIWHSVSSFEISVTRRNSRKRILATTAVNSIDLETLTFFVKYLLLLKVVLI